MLVCFVSDCIYESQLAKGVGFSQVDSLHRLKADEYGVFSLHMAGDLQGNDINNADGEMLPSCTKISVFDISKPNSREVSGTRTTLCH